MRVIDVAEEVYHKIGDWISYKQVRLVFVTLNDLSNGKFYRWLSNEFGNRKSRTERMWKINREINPSTNIDDINKEAGNERT